MKVQSKKEAKRFIASSEFTAEDEQEAIEVFTMKCLVRKHIELGKDKPKTELFEHWWN